MQAELLKRVAKTGSGTNIREISSVIHEILRLSIHAQSIGFHNFDDLRDAADISDAADIANLIEASVNEWITNEEEEDFMSDIRTAF